MSANTIVITVEINSCEFFSNDARLSDAEKALRMSTEVNARIQQYKAQGWQSIGTVWKTDSIQVVLKFRRILPGLW